MDKIDVRSLHGLMDTEAVAVELVGAVAEYWGETGDGVAAA